MLTGDLLIAMKEIHAGAMLSWSGPDASFVIKTTRIAAASFRGNGVTVLVNPQMVMYEDTGAVYLFYTQFNDKPDAPAGFLTYLNPAESFGRRLIERLTHQQHLDFAIYDMKLAHVFTKRIPWRAQVRADIADALQQATAHNDGLARIDYAASLEQVKEDFSLESLRQ